MDVHTLIVVAVFGAVYIGMALGRWPTLAIDRTGIALCGAIILLVADGASGVSAAQIDVRAIAILFGLMVLSAQFAASGFYGSCAARVAETQASPALLLALVVGVTGALSAILVNDIVVFAMAPILCRGLAATGRNPLPYLLGAAGAANAGSAATLLGNPQNILIGEHADLDFWHFATVALPPAALSLVVVYVTVLLSWTRTLHEAPGPSSTSHVAVEPVALDRGGVVKATVALIGLLGLFATPLPRWQSALLIAGLLLISRRHTTREMLAFVDWHLLILFGGLFVVTSAFGTTELGPRFLMLLATKGLSFDEPLFLGVASLLGSNTIGNVPFVMLVLAAIPDLSVSSHYALALLSTLAGNLLLVGSFATLIVVEQSRRQGVTISFADHLRAGVPMTLLTMGLTAAWLAVVNP